MGRTLESPGRHWPGLLFLAALAGLIVAGLLLGMTSRDPNLGFTAGVTWVFKGFTIP